MPHLSRTSLPSAIVTAKGAKLLRRGSPWCYRTELAVPPDTEEPGALVSVLDPQKNFIGQAFHARSSPLALRLLTRSTPEAEAVDEAFFRRRLERALTRRGPLARREGYRWVHGEADGLPGLFVDRYGPGLTVQTLSEGADARKALLTRLLLELGGDGVTHCILRDDGSGRDFEGLAREKRVLRGSSPAMVSYREGDNAFEVDLLEDMKTGSFLDQVDNHLRAGELAFGEALDLFSYHGGFALALAGRCAKVTAVEQDGRAAARIRANAARNGKAQIEVLEGNAFDVLRQYDEAGRRFDTLVLDPPGLAKRKHGLGTALRAYRELNLRALRCMRPEGLLVTCSCSGKVSLDEFQRVVLSAASDAKRTVQLIERRGAGIDHPVLPTLSESEYLKVLFLRVL